jgi:hypothetical protein
MLGGAVVACRRLTAGLTAAVHRVTVERDGAPRDVVLRQYDAPTHAALVDRESRTMEAARTAGLPAPRSWPCRRTAMPAGCLRSS